LNVSKRILDIIYKGKLDLKKKDLFFESLFICRVKQAAYKTYVDVKHQSKLLVEKNIEKVKVLDIYIDLQSSYFLLPENGVYYE
jgi:hypothetical protein